MHTQNQKEYEKYGLRSEEELEEYLEYQKNPITLEELQKLIKANVQKEFRERIEYSEATEEQAQSETLQQEIIELALRYYNDQNIGYYENPLLPVKRTEIVTNQAFIDCFYNEHCIRYIVEECFEHCFQLQTTYPFTFTKQKIVSYVIQARMKREYYDFFANSVTYYMKKFLFDLLEEKYGESISYEESNSSQEWEKELCEVETKILQYFEDIITTDHEGMYGMKFTRFPKRMLTDIKDSFLQTLEEDTVRKTCMRYIETVSLKHYPQDQNEKESVRELIQFYQGYCAGEEMITLERVYDTPSTLQERIVNALFITSEMNTLEVPVALVNEIEQFHNKRSVVDSFEEVTRSCSLFFQELMVHVQETHEIVILTNEKPLTLGEITNLTITYSGQGYPHVLGFVGNRLFLSTTEVEVDVALLEEIQNNTAHVISIKNKDHVQIFETKEIYMYE